MRKKVILPLLVIATGCGTLSKTSHLDTSLPIDERVDALMSQMTLEEKVAQMLAVRLDKDPGQDFGLGQGRGLDEINPAHGLGQRTANFNRNMTTGPEEYVAARNNFQKAVMGKSRLKIPVSFHNECLFGAQLKDATHFPAPLGLGSTWDPELVKEAFAVSALECRAVGIDHVLSPVMDIAMDPRFGRVSEMFGEDPWLVGTMGVAAIKGLQGNNPERIPADKVVTTGKHFTAHSAPEGGKNRAPHQASERYLRNYLMLPFKWAVQKADMRSLMASYNEVDGIPCHANPWLLRTVLRDEWGFEGAVVSDYQGITMVKQPMAVAESWEKAAELCIKAGVDIELPFPNCYAKLTQLVKEGKVDEKLIDEGCRRMLKLKFETGLFENPYTPEKNVRSKFDTPAHRKLARKVAQKSMVLVENKGGLLPLSPRKYRKIAVIGPNANSYVMPRYSGTPPYYVTPFEGIKKRAGKNAQVFYAEGCTTDMKREQFRAKNQKLIAEAVATANKSDVVVLAIGGWQMIGCEAYDRPSVKLYGWQQELADAMFATGKPVVITFIGSRPLAIPDLQQKAKSIIVGWYPGQETGNAFADVIFGDINPGGKLTMSWPRIDGQNPIYYWKKLFRERPYVDLYKSKVGFGRPNNDKPLWPFGHGLSFTKFEISKPKLDEATIATDGSTKVRVTVTNKGKRAGDEVVQLYIRDLFSSCTRPVRELRGFKRITLKPDESKEVVFEIGTEELQFVDILKEWTVEPGGFDIMVGSSSALRKLKKTTLTVK